MKWGHWAGVFGLLGVSSCLGAKSNFDHISWCDGPLVYSVKVPTLDPAGDSPEILAGGIQAAMARWNQALGIDLFQLRPLSGLPEGEGNGMNEIYFLSGSARSPYLATAYPKRERSRKVIEGDIQFIPGRSWYNYRGPLRHEANGDRVPEIYRIALHEMGHILGFSHPLSETDGTIMRARISDIDDLTKKDLRDAQSMAALLFEKNAPRITSPHRAKISIRGSAFRLQGKGNPFFIPVVTIKISSSTGLRIRHVRVSKAWSRKISLGKGTNRLRFSYRGVDRARVRFATKVIDVR